MSDDWQDSVNLQLNQLHDDLRRLTGWIIAGLIAPFLAIIGLYVYTGAQAERVEARIAGVEGKVSTQGDRAETRIVGVEAKISALAVEQAKMNGKLDLLLERKQVAAR